MAQKKNLKKRKKLTRAERIEIYGKWAFYKDSPAKRRAAAGRVIANNEKYPPVHQLAKDDKTLLHEHRIEKYG